MNIVEILKLGLIGLVFLLSFLSYRLLNIEQKKTTPSLQVLKAINRFMWMAFISALLVGTFNVIEIYMVQDCSKKRIIKDVIGGASSESCQTLVPDISVPRTGEEVSSPFKVHGTVSHYPKESYLWVTAFNSNMQQYTDLVPIDKKKKQWAATLRFVGGKIKDRYIIEIVLANKEANQKLSKFSVTKVQELPVLSSNIQTCGQVEVTLVQ